ncbi:MAG: TetR/AcrR family transcriptional regulator [Candidatus Hydrogenedentes bacterium]|nr:TetR/AcrR family transcriptional regulator [Candidatus Hydrogenedentota bacterium]
MSTPGLASTNEAEIKLLDSALRLFSQQGYEGTSIREIIEGAGVTRPVLYYYFENKEDLFQRLFETKFNDLIERINEAASAEGPCIPRLKGIIAGAFELAEENGAAVQLILQVLFSAPQQGPSLDRQKLMRQRFKIVEKVIRHGLDNKELSGGDSQSLTLVFLGIMDMHMMAKSNRMETRLSSELALSLVDLFVAGAKYRALPETNLVSPYAF